VNKAGREGEEKAAALLEKSGMRIIARNVRFKTGEIDLVDFD
jgi:Holliday junction resolvase-like predicted endonuclease